MLSGLAVQIIGLVRTATAAMNSRTWFAAICGFFEGAWGRRRRLGLFLLNL